MHIDIITKLRLLATIYIVCYKTKIFRSDKLFQSSLPHIWHSFEHLVLVGNNHFPSAKRKDIKTTIRKYEKDNNAQNKFLW